MNINVFANSINEVAINGKDTKAPIFETACKKQSFCGSNLNCWEGFAELSVKASDNKTAATELTYTYEIDLHKNGTVDIRGNSSNASGNYDLGEHSISWKVEDTYGNINSCSYDFSINDCKGPTPLCKNGIAVELEADNKKVALQATDFNQGSYDNCSIAEFRMASPSKGPGQSTPPAGDQLIFDCDKVGTHSVDMWVKDVNGNWDYCTTYLVVQSNNIQCDVDKEVATELKATKEDPTQSNESVSLRTSKKPLRFIAKDEHLNSGDTYQIDFRAEDINHVIGYQYTISFDQELLDFVELIPGALPGIGMGNFGLTKLSDGAITTSWDRNPEISLLEEDAILYSLIFEAKAETSWKEALTFASQYTRAEAYSSDYELLEVELDFIAQAIDSEHFEVFPIQPNPFVEETLISFSLPKATSLTYTIQNVAGQLVYNKNIEAATGYNEILIHQSLLKEPGVYFITLETKTHRVSQRMILMKE